MPRARRYVPRSTSSSSRGASPIPTDDALADDLIVDTTDVDGVPVRCARSRRIEKIAANHPELDGQEERVAGAVREPDASGTLFVKVVVQYRSEEGGTRGRIVTAFLTARPARAGDTVLFLSPEISS